MLVSCGCRPLACVAQWVDTGYRLVPNATNPEWTGYLLNVTSQTWLTEAQVSLSVWHHQLMVFVPADLSTSNIGAIYNTDGEPRARFAIHAPFGLRLRVRPRGRQRGCVAPGCGCGGVASVYVRAGCPEPQHGRVFDAACTHRRLLHPTGAQQAPTRSLPSLRGSATPRST